MYKVKLGYISKPHGIKGGVIFKPSDIDSRTLRDGLQVYLTDEKGEEIIKEVQTVSYGNKIILHFVDIFDRNQAELIIGKSVEVLKTVLLDSLESNEFLLSDLIGFEVFDQGGSLGKVFAFSSNGAQDLIRIKNKSGKFMDLLFIQDFILELDIGGKKIKLNVPEGLI